MAQASKAACSSGVHRLPKVGRLVTRRNMRLEENRGLLDFIHTVADNIVNVSRQGLVIHSSAFSDDCTSKA